MPAPLRLTRGGTLSFERVRIMGVLNVTPDSFYDGGRYLAPEHALERGQALEDAGADMIDVGGESTRPGSAPVSPAEQVRRVVPVIKALAAQLSCPISVDTTSAKVAEAALDAGAGLVNDISAFLFDPEMLPLLADRDVPAVAMHTLAEPAVMQQAPRYDEVVDDVVGHLRERLEACSAAGVDRQQVVLDPGIGFGKTLAHNLALLQGLPALTALGSPVLVGTSNKSFLGQLTGRPVGERLMATAGSCCAAIMRGAHLLRVHDVAAIRDALVVADAVLRCSMVDYDVDSHYR